MLEANVKLPGHRFWPDSISVADVLAEVGKRVVGHQQITDAYLLALAIHHRGRLATMDESIRSLGNGVELIPRPSA